MEQRTPVQVGGSSAWRRLEVGGGRVEGDPPARLVLPPVASGYGDAQLDDGPSDRPAIALVRRPGTRLTLRARFSHDAGKLVGTAGFGFWNAPFAPETRRIALPQATWFFFASPPSDLPLAETAPGRGWFASTIDASRHNALPLIPLAPMVVLLNQFAPLRRRVWPVVRRRLGISFAPVPVDLREWHSYALDWKPGGCTFHVDDRVVLTTPHSPDGPLSFVCWIDNQSLVLTPRGRFSWRTLPTAESQWMELDELSVEPAVERAYGF